MKNKAANTPNAFEEIVMAMISMHISLFGEKCAKGNLHYWSKLRLTWEETIECSDDQKIMTQFERQIFWVIAQPARQAI